MRHHERVLTGNDHRAGMWFDPAQVPTDLKEPSMEAGQPPARAASGWICPRCRAVWAPHIDRCTCEPVSADTRTEITE